MAAEGVVIADMNTEQLIGEQLKKESEYFSLLKQRARIAKTERKDANRKLADIYKERKEHKKSVRLLKKNSRKIKAKEKVLQEKRDKITFEAEPAKKKADQKPAPKASSPSKGPELPVSCSKRPIASVARAP